MESIQHVCARDHSPEEIRAWGCRDFRESDRILAIEKDFVWVLEQGNAIGGYCHFSILEMEGVLVGNLRGLYLMARAVRQGFGGEMLNRVLEAARKKRVAKIILFSTLTAHAFYLEHEFNDVAPMTELPINGVPIRCFPMERIIDLRTEQP